MAGPPPIQPQDDSGLSYVCRPGGDNPALCNLQAVKMHAGGKPASREQSSKAGLRRYAAVAATVLSCALIGISLLQQQWPACWDSLTPV